MISMIDMMCHKSGIKFLRLYISFKIESKKSLRFSYFQVLLVVCASAMKCFCNPACGASSLLHRSNGEKEPKQLELVVLQQMALSNAGTLAISRPCMCKKIFPMLTILTTH